MVNGDHGTSEAVRDICQTGSRDGGGIWAKVMPIDKVPVTTENGGRWVG